MSGKRINAHITIMAALSMTIVLSLISTCIKSASDCYYNTQIKEACMLSVEAAFSSYHNDMLNEYDIFLLENTDRIETKIEKYVEKSGISSVCSPPPFCAVRMLRSPLTAFSPLP